MSEVIRSDAQLQQDVLRELRWDSRVEQTDVGVEVDGGVITLTGTVSSWAKKNAAQEAAHRVLGVLDVANDLDVRLPGMVGRTDTDLALAVRHALEWDAFVPDTLIRTTVTDGAVTLEGVVDHWAERTDAERCIRDLHGVRGVENRIAIRAPAVPPEEIRRSIEAALERHAERQAHRVEIEIQDGHVVVKGTVRGWSDRNLIVGAVRGTRGVGMVDDRLRIDSKR